MKKKLVNFLSIFILILFLDQLTKFYALRNFIDDYKINNNLSFNLGINRGISWSFLDSQNKYVFVLISIIIFLILLMLIYYSFLQYKNNKNIFAEVLIISGGFSNLIDRVIHCGVVDFIDISYNNLHWPLFNLADISIVFGLLIILITNFKE